jgi:AraC-like DNA-binding protein/quercetin dioxygenase-like cupin family protein
MNRAQTQFECDTFSVVRFDHPPDAPHIDPPEETSESYSLIFVQQGEFSVTIGREGMRLSTGDLLIMVPGLPQRYSHMSTRPDDVCLSLQFEPETGDELFGRHRNGKRRLPASNRSRYLHSRICNLVQTSETRLAEALVLDSMQTLLSNSTGSEHLYKATQLQWYADRIDFVRELVETDFAEPHSLGSLARATGMSRLHFAHVFRELMGVSAYAYLLCRRLEAARQRLKDGASVTEACFAVGFNNLSHFIRTFRRHFGTAPSRFRGRS